MHKILFVCHGNICRSPMAEFYFKNLIRQHHMERRFLVSSAATTAEEIRGGKGSPIYPPALRELMDHGIGVPGNELGVHEKRARLMTIEDYSRFDLLIGMDAENRRDMLRIAGGDPEHKIRLLLDFTDHPRNVADPWYTRDFRAAWDDIETGCRALWNYSLENPSSR